MLKPGFAILLLTTAAGGAMAQDSAPDACAALSGLGLADTAVALAAEVEAAGDLPPYCRVAGTIRPAIGFEVRLPASDWNGKFYMAGCGGFCGKVDAESPNTFNAINHALRRGYATATMDGGHWGTGSTDARWAAADPVAEADWGYRAVEETTRVAKALTEAYYDTAPERSYFDGCSTGGRMANMAALRMPDAFDGIISGAPALDYPGLVGTSFAWIAQANDDGSGGRILDSADAQIVAGAVTAQCDAADGVEDGMVSDPATCDFDPSTLDLSPEKIAVLEAWYSEPKDSQGRSLFPASVPVGSEPFWPLWLTGLPGGGGALVPEAFGPNFLRYMAFPDDPGADYGPQDFDFDTDPARMAPQEAIYNSDDPDLGAFAESGGKLLMYHGWADAIVFPGKTVDYFETLGQTTEGDFARLFMIPGMDHCGIQGTGPGIAQDGFDALGALDAWVETGTPPDSLPTTKVVDGTPQWSRPVCAWPARAAFGGEGDWRDAANWTCEEG
ncbi:tannase/feruloyl esterase family alpha/beta hydrolase [Jannaschia rubra]|uniref:tannase/feruloyl esterase family alpha/beta hydrolase n=1 Tax=Jannaschia rubra TaxID=282197 RepID=UPI0024939458|nr:tannase/feruloyl esterase family alpha/beta hydrolase [Jannaschia rubra]